MTALCTNPRSPSLGFPASGRASKNAADHQGARASFGLVDIKWNRSEPDTFSSLSAPPPRRVKHRDAEPAVQDRPAIHSACTPPVLHMEPTRFGGFPGQEKTVAHSRDLARRPFATAIANLRTSWCVCLTMPGLASASPGLFGKVLGQGVGAPLALIFNVNPSSTIRLAASRLSNSGFPA